MFLVIQYWWMDFFLGHLFSLNILLIDDPGCVGLRSNFLVFAELKTYLQILQGGKT